MNTPIQGSAADIIKFAMLRVDAVLQDQLPEAQILLQVHDELVLRFQRDRWRLRALL